MELLSKGPTAQISVVVRCNLQRSFPESDDSWTTTSKYGSCGWPLEINQRLFGPGNCLLDRTTKSSVISAIVTLIALHPSNGVIYELNRHLRKLVGSETNYSLISGGGVGNFMCVVRAVHTSPCGQQLDNNINASCFQYSIIFLGDFHIIDRSVNSVWNKRFYIQFLQAHSSISFHVHDTGV